MLYTVKFNLKLIESQNQKQNLNLKFKNEKPKHNLFRKYYEKYLCWNSLNKAESYDITVDMIKDHRLKDKK